MSGTSENKRFLEKSKEKGFDKQHRKTINFNISKYDTAVKKGQESLYSNIELARRRAGYIKNKVVNDLDKYLIEFEGNFLKNGGKIIWARDASEALNEIIKVIKKHDLSSAVKSKSMTTEELDLNPVLEKNGVKTLETDLGEFIVQQAGQKPYHIVTPAMHMSKEDVATLYNTKFNTPSTLSPEELTLYTRNLLREKFQSAELGITGANFLIAETGSIALTENEGNGLLSMSFPKIHIAIAGIEKVIPRIEDIDLYWPLLATHGTGQYLTVYNSIISGPRKFSEKDGPEELILVLLDNGRTNILTHERQRQALSCIRCGACLNACPVYKNIGGHTYKTTYSGPIGSIITPFLKDFNSYKHLSYASSLCGKCTTVCPVKIPLHELLLVNRNHAVKNGHTKFVEKQAIKISNKVFKSRKRLDMISGGKKSKLAKKFAARPWGKNREFPHIAEKSFNQLWREQHD